MNKIWTFLGNMTLWNWLTLIVFPLALLGGVNSFFSLKSRYLNWQGVQSKKNFIKRLQQLEVQLFAIEKYKKEPSEFFIRVLDDVRKPAILFIAFCLLTLNSIFFQNINPSGKGAQQIIFILGQLFFIWAFALATRLSNLIARVSTPELFAIDLIRFVNNAKTKGLLPIEDNTLVDKLLKSEMFHAGERKFVESYIDTHLITKAK